MASLRFLLPTVCLLASCTTKIDNPSEHGLPPVADNGGATDQRDLTGTLAGAEAGHAGSKSRDNRKSDDSATQESPSSSMSASGGASGGGTSDPLPPPATSCDLDGSCITDCKARSVTCGVQPSGPFYCEFDGFKGATAQVTCNQRAVIGMACCGGCGCVPVEVYFDGTYCWQGIPECSSVESLRNRMLDPHLPTTADPSYTLPASVPGSFYLGSGGFAGNDTAGGNGGVAGDVAGTGGSVAGTGGTGTGTGGTGGSGTAGADRGGAAGWDSEPPQSAAGRRDDNGTASGGAVPQAGGPSPSITAGDAGAPELGTGSAP